MQIIHHNTPAPDYRVIAEAAYNLPTARVPLYEHLVNDEVMTAIMGKSYGELMSNGDVAEAMSLYCEFYYRMGYDAVSFECCVGGALEGGGSLGGHKPPTITSMQQLEQYPWDAIPARFFERFAPMYDAFAAALPGGMLGIGGVGNGVFEIAQELCGYMELCYMRADDPELYDAIFRRIGKLLGDIWAQFLPKYGHLFAVCRFGDDLGFNTSTMLPADDIRRLLIPAYKGVIDKVHAAGKPFLLHSCGYTQSVMDDLVDVAGINAKHSNEDGILPFTEWVNLYGKRIGNFGGIDLNLLCTLDEASVKAWVADCLNQVTGHGGIAFSSGNSIPGYVPVANYVAMTEAVREYTVKG